MRRRCTCALVLVQVLTDRRIAHMSKKPLTAIEFIQPLAKVDPVYKEEEDSFKVLVLVHYSCTRS